MSQRIGIGGIWHETNTFARPLTLLTDFRPWQEEGMRSEISGALDACRRSGVTPVPLYAAAALPGGVVAASARRSLWERFLGELEAALPLDGLVLTLHGAMVAEDAEDPESDLLAAVRERLDDLPVAVTLDLHANPGDGLLAGADVVLPYDTYPHVDAYERGEEAVTVLLDAIEGRLRPRVGWQRLPLLTCPLGQATAEEPMASLIALAHRWEERPELVCAGLVPGYPYADVPHLGFTVTACGREAGAAERCVAALAEAVWERRDDFRRELATPEDGVARALAAARTPVVVADVSDNVGGGAPGNGTALLRALLEAGAYGAVVVLWDPASAREAAAGAVELEVGEPPLALRGKLVRAEAVRYRRSSSYMTGQLVDMGLCAVVEVDGVELVLTSERVMPFDADHLRALGIEPAERRLLVVKSALAWQAGFGDIAAEAIYVDGPGITTCRLETLRYERFRT